MSQSRIGFIGPLAVTTSRKISGLEFRASKGKVTISRLPSGLRDTPRALSASRQLFKTNDKVWTAFEPVYRRSWNVIGSRRHTCGYWVFMSYHLRNHRVAETPAWTSDYPNNLEPKP